MTLSTSKHVIDTQQPNNAARTVRWIPLLFKNSTHIISDAHIIFLKRELLKELTRRRI
jgi:hypothetical protein